MKIILKIICVFIISILVIARESDGSLTLSLRAAIEQETTDAELEEFSELLLSKDVRNDNGAPRLDLQNKVYSNIPSTRPLLQYATGRREPETYSLLQQLFKAYEDRGNVGRAKDNFLNEILNTEVMEETIRFLNKHGLRINKSTMKNYLDTIWFTSYSRGRGINSSGFQHVFMAELKNNEVKGLHNWIFFVNQQNKNQLNYIGYNKAREFAGYPSSIVKIRYQWKGVEKPSGSMFVATSPELEMALYSTCFLFRPDKDCNLKLGAVSIIIKTHKFEIRNRGVASEQVIGSAYPTF